MDEASKPLRDFLVRFAREKDVSLFVEIAHAPAPRTPADLDLKILIPAYILSELKTGFQIGAVLFLPFLVIDLVVASVTLSVGMVQLPPVMISAPFKILLFVLVDGWNLVVGSLMKSFYHMTPDSVVQILRQTLMTAFWLAAPLLAVGFVTGIVVSLVQIATSMQDTAFSTVPRLVAFLSAILLLLPWMLQRSMAYAVGHPGGPGPLCPLASRSRRQRSMPFCWCWRAWAGRWSSCRCRDERRAATGARGVRAGLHPGALRALAGSGCGRASRARR